MEAAPQSPDLGYQGRCLGGEGGPVIQKTVGCSNHKPLGELCQILAVPMGTTAQLPGHADFQVTSHNWAFTETVDLKQGLKNTGICQTSGLCISGGSDLEPKEVNL